VPGSGELARAGRDHTRFVNFARAHRQPSNVSPTHQEIAAIADPADGDWVFMIPRLWCGAQANSSPSNSGSMAMGEGR
jgi:hypothetical protein